MKPAFALDFRNDAISLLHRASGGWHQVGRVTFDEPDLPTALGYLRSTALGLSPRGLATKLILPDDQILVTIVDAPGPDDASRAAQIRAALEGRTPYPVEELVFDWEIAGGEVRVAVVWRETLTEAEAFAAEHRFNPVSFVAAPAESYEAEPWFGPTAQAASLLADGEAVERDGEQVVVFARGPLEDSDTAAKDEVAVSSAVEEEAAPTEPAEISPEIAVKDATESSDDNAKDPADDLAPQEPDLPKAAPDEISQEALAELTAEVQADQAAQDTDPATDPEPFDLTPGRDQPLFGLADDEPAPSQVFASKTQAVLPVALNQTDDLDEDLAAALQDIVLQDEAPMAVDVEADDDGDPAEPGAAGGLPAGARVTDPGIPDEVPPMPGYSPAMGFASRRASAAEPSPAPKLAAPPPRPTVSRPAAAKPLPPAAPKAERPMVDRPTAVNLPPARESKGLRGLGALVTAPGLPGGRKKKAAAMPAVAPSPGAAASTLSPTASPMADDVPTGQAGEGATSVAATRKRASSLEKGLGAGRTPVRGKPRYLGLILTGLLLLVLAVIAAWSTSLAFREDPNTTTDLAATEMPAPEDEMLADGILPEDAGGATAEMAEAEPDTAIAETALAEAAAQTDSDTAPPEVQVGAEPGATPERSAPGSTAGDEIVLAAIDPAPEAPAPVDLPEAVAQGDPPPEAQAPPPPFGTVYQFDENGLIVPTPEGIVTPEGVRLVAGKPPLVPKPRPEGLAPPAPAEASLPAGETDAASVLQTTADPALAGFRPKPRPEGLTPPVQLNQDAAPTISDNRLAGKRPQARPEAVLAAGAAAKAAKQAAAASLATQPEATANAPASKLAVSISRRPEPRPRDLSRAVEAAVAAAVRAPEPKTEPEPEPAKTASLVPQKSTLPKPKPQDPEEPAKKAAKAAPSSKKAEVEADDEPELASAPASKQSGSVAKQATFKNALALDKTALIGVYGTPSKRYAMIRTSGGRYKKVKIGDSIDGGRVQAITASEVRYQKGSRLLTLSLPKG